MRMKQSSSNTHVAATMPASVDDGDSAAMLVFEFLNEIGFSTGDLQAAEFKPVVVRLLAALDLRVASPDRLEAERDMIAQQDMIEADHVARLRQRLRNMNGCEAENDLPF
jgi:hypothetical protein